MSTILSPRYRDAYQPPVFLIEKVDLTFEMDASQTVVTSRLQCQRNPSTTDDITRDLILNGENLKLSRVTVDEKILNESDYKLTEKQLIIFALPDRCVIETVVEIDPKNNTTLDGLYYAKNVFCTQCEPEGFRHITFFPDRPDVMAQFTTTIIANKKQFPILLSNGNLVASGDLADDKHWVRWEDPFKKPSYLFALVACDMDCLEDIFVTQSGRHVTIQIYVEKGCVPQAKFALQAVKKAMRWDEVTFDREYDLDIYMIVAVSDFNMGAMENKGLNIFNDKYILATPDRATDTDFLNVETVIAHEYFHNWSGNRVTCRDWFQLSLKEGLTIFREQLFISDMTSPTVARIDEVDYMRTVQFSEDNSPLAHAVRPESYIEINNFYTATVYNKGAEVIRMLRTLVGIENFRLGMNLYFDRHDGQAVTIEDFIRAHEDTAGCYFEQFRLWYSQVGTPHVIATDRYLSEKQSYSLTLKQVSFDKKTLHIPVQMGLLTEQGEEICSELLECRDIEQTFTFENISTKPIPSLLRGFSAPVNLTYDYSDAALNILFQHDTDGFNRHEAEFRLAVNHIFRLMKNPSVSSELQQFLNGFQTIFKTAEQDYGLSTRLFMLPSEKYLAEQMTVVDVEGIYHARAFLEKSIASAVQNDFHTTWQMLNESVKSHALDIESTAARAFKNRCLHYLLLLNDSNLHQIGVRQFHAALGVNMTDTIAALAGLVNVMDCRDAVLTDFYKRWQDNPLVLDKWFAIQANAKLSDTLDRVKSLMQHPAFDMRNPNKVYALIGSFGGNTMQFHQKSGAGYQFLARVVSELDRLNPQVAARMIKPLVTWRRFDVTRQQLMQTALKEIAQGKKISTDLYEIITKSLNEEMCNKII